MIETIEKVKAFLANDLGLDVSVIEDTSPLFTSGLIDSFALIEMLSYLESEFNCKIDIADLSIDNLDTLESISKLVSANL